MITPIIIPILFWIGTIGCIIVGIVLIATGVTVNSSLGVVFNYFFLGPIVVRVCCEFVLILFSINDKLTDIKGALEHQRDNDNQPSFLDEKQ